MVKKLGKTVLSFVLSLTMVMTLLPVSTYAQTTDNNSHQYKIVHLDCGRKYFSVNSIKKIIDNAASSGFNSVELAVGNDGLRFLLDDMSITVNGKTYSSEEVTNGIKRGNKTYSDFETNELTESEMNGILAYAKSKNVEIIPLVNTPGHMDAMLDCIEALSGTTLSYNGSARTIDVTNSTAVAFTKALLQKYIDYFAAKGCKTFNMGADEYANDKFTSGGMGFGQLQSQNQYNQFVSYVNELAKMIKDAGMTPMAFNDGIYYNRVTDKGTFDNNIIISYWSNGWSGYNVASAQFLASQGFKMVNTHGDYYWVLGKSDWQCDAEKASQFNITTFPGSTIDNPAGAMFCIWCDFPQAGNEDMVVNSTEATIKAFGATISDTSVDEPSNTLKEKQITLSVGSTATETVENVDLTNNVVKEELDENIASVNAQYTQIAGETKLEKVTNITSGNTYLISDGNGNYLSLDGSSLINSTDPAQATKWTITKSSLNYTIKSSSKYLRRSTGGTLTTSTNSTNWKYNSASGFYITSSGNTYYLIFNNSWQTSNSTNTSYGVPYTVTTTEPVNATTITFTGMSVGTTSVIVGDTRYTIVVQDHAPDNAMTKNTLDIEYWITNNQVYTIQDTSSATKTTIDSSTAASEEGVDITTLAPGIAYGDYDGWIKLNFWQAVREDKDNHQTNSAGDDETADGTAFTHVRYRNGAWQYKTLDGVWHYFDKEDQAVAYYMRHTEITQEITTAMKDWGYETNGTTPNTSGNKGQVALTVAVVYPDGTVSPAEGNMYSKSTTIFNYWDGRNIGIIAPLNNSDYDISKITVTNGKRKSNTSSNTWSQNDSINWDKTTNAAGNQWYDETEIWNDTMETKPMVNGALSNITWPNKNTGKLVLIYLKPIHHDSNLTVKWVDDSDKGALIHSQEVVVSYEGTQEPVTFLNGLKQNSNVSGGDIILDDDAYIENSSGVKQTFNKDITVIQGVAGKYTSGLYKYTSADISNDGKTLTLHYTMNTTDLNKQYVIDYGLPISIPLTDLVDNVNNVNTVVPSANAKYDSINKTITYTPEKILNSTEIVTVRVEYTTGDPVAFNIGFVPATSVYYEENFIDFTNNSWKDIGNSLGGTQEVNTIPYGTDHAYNENKTFSNGKAKEVTIEQGGDTQTATFDFTGTGFDLYSQTGTDNGLMKVEVFKKDTEEKVKTVSVQNTGVNTLYQIPVISIENLDYGTYTVKVTGYGAFTNENYPSLNRGGRHVIDAVQVYDTIDTSTNKDVLDLYQKDNEAYVQRLEIRNKIISSQQYSDTDNGDGVLHIEMNGSEGKVQDYTMVGPNNEVYFYNTNTVIGFILETSTPAKSIQIGAKSVNGKPVTLKTIIGNKKESFDINTNTAQNYVLNLTNNPYEEVEGKYQYKIYLSKESGNGILSVTDVKATFDGKATAEFKYDADTVNVYVESTNKTVEINKANIVGRARYGRKVTFEVTTNKELSNESFVMTVGSKEYKVNNGLTVSKPVSNSGGTYTYTLQMTPYTYKLLGQTDFNIYVLDSNEAKISSKTVSTRIYLL